ncbi:aldolase catalytic domain-containing protein [Amylibacter sp.]|nr:aldolase catalytic domain-containing protein [Amylibacter sp.]
MPSNFKILDCTLRDGGYYNNWDFSFDLVNAYLEAVSLSGIDYVELGLRDFPKDFYRGPYAYTTERHLNRLSLPRGPEYGVMINTSSIIARKGSLKDNVGILFCDQEDSKLSFVRVACHFHEVDVGVKIAKALKVKGYLVGLNLMQAEGRSSKQLKSSILKIINCKSVDVLYFADSFGRMSNNEVKRITLEIKQYWNSPIGIHTHNNMGHAITNTLYAKQLGVSWHDCTITGMGRGAGNAASELLVSELSHNNEKYNGNPLLKLAVEHFDDMKKKLGWGMSSVYYLGAMNSIHPTYIQKLLADPHFTKASILDFITKISKQGGAKYSGENFNKFKKLVNQENTGLKGKPILSGSFGREALLIGGGDSIALHKEAIEDFVSFRKLTVASVNVNHQIKTSLIDYIFLTKNTKYTIDRGLYEEQLAKFILPFSRFTLDELGSNFPDNTKYDYALKLSEDFSFEIKGCSSPFDLTAIYALAGLISQGVERIFLVGFDGYSDHMDPRHSEMAEAFTYIDQTFPRTDIISLLPSRYKVKIQSIYGY